jgi:sn-glycerol 3-phosphate transport system ATP-binding protein
MNLLPAVAAESGIALADGTLLPLPANGGGVAAGRPLTLGIRPEHLAAGGDGAALRVTVELAEMLGADTIIHGRLSDGSLLQARLPGAARAHPGEILALAVDPGLIHLFDRETGRRI